jgi:hypothetical protein
MGRSPPYPSCSQPAFLPSYLQALNAEMLIVRMLIGMSCFGNALQPIGFQDFRFVYGGGDLKRHANPLLACHNNTTMHYFDFQCLISFVAQVS